MKSCREIEPLCASYVDGDVSPGDRASVQAHLEACPPCREAVAGQRTAREVLVARREGLRPGASGALRARCAAHRHRAAGAARSAWRPALTGWRTLVPVSLAASILLAVAGVFIYSAVNQVEALASQLAADHVKCASLVSPGPGDPAASAWRWEQANGWSVRVPASAADHDLEFLTIRRCLVTAGRTAHLMYTWRGQPLSVFVLPDGLEALGAQRIVETFGHEAIMWSSDGRTYVVVARARPDELESVVRYVRAHAR